MLRPPEATVALPDDPSVAALPPEVRETAARVWSGRAVSELTAATTFARIAPVVIGSSCASEVQWLAARAVSDEVRHAALCHAVASAYRGSEEPWPGTRRVEPSRALAAVDGPLGNALAVVTVCCIQETLGTALLEHALAATRAPLPWQALRALLADEVDHARIGWAYLAGLRATDRAEVAARLPALLAECLAHWRQRTANLPPRGVPDHGCPEPAVTGPLIAEAARTLLAPGFAYVGIDVAEAVRLATEGDAPAV